MVANFCRAPQVPIASCRASFAEKIVNKHYAVANETVRADVHQFANKRVGLDFGAGPDSHMSLDFYKRSDKNIVTKGASIQVGWKDDFDVGPILYLDEARFE